MGTDDKQIKGIKWPSVKYDRAPEHENEKPLTEKSLVYSATKVVMNIREGTGEAVRLQRSFDDVSRNPLRRERLWHLRRCRVKVPIAYEWLISTEQWRLWYYHGVNKVDMAMLTEQEELAEHLIAENPMSEEGAILKSAVPLMRKGIDFDLKRRISLKEMALKWLGIGQNNIAKYRLKWRWSLLSCTDFDCSSDAMQQRKRMFDAIASRQNAKSNVDVVDGNESKRDEADCDIDIDIEHQQKGHDGPLIDTRSDKEELIEEEVEEHEEDVVVTQRMEQQHGVDEDEDSESQENAKNSSGNDRNRKRKSSEMDEGDCINIKNNSALQTGPPAKRRKIGF